MNLADLKLQQSQKLFLGTHYLTVDSLKWKVQVQSSAKMLFIHNLSSIPISFLRQITMSDMLDDFVNEERITRVWKIFFLG